MGIADDLKDFKLQMSDDIKELKKRMDVYEDELLNNCVAIPELKMELKTQLENVNTNVAGLQVLLKEQLNSQWRIIKWLLIATLLLSGVKVLPELFKIL